MQNSWTYEKPEPFKGTKAERLDLEAEDLDRQAKQLEGCSWVGDISPSEACRRKAADKREYAMLLRQLDKANGS